MRQKFRSFNRGVIGLDGNHALNPARDDTLHWHLRRLRMK
jgi:hypothetical protein